MASMLVNMGVAYMEQRIYDQALQHYKEAVGLAKQQGDKQVTMIAYGNLGKLHDVMNRHRKAAECYSEAAQLADEMGLLDVARNYRSQIRFF